MDVQSIWQGLGIRDRRNLYLALALPIVGLATLKLVGVIAPPRSRSRATIYRSPRKSLQLLSAGGNEGGDEDSCPYPSDALPGARDVDTPYGNIRVYEWGPEAGRKVLFVHGISTPCVAFAGMAERLVRRGCRVMLFDLFGRGYSDAPDPSVYRQDAGLFAAQMLLVLASSALPWTRFSLVGYSLGGGVTASFTSYFPDMVDSLVLVAPSGLIRPHHINGVSRLLYGNLMPEFAANYFVSRRLRGSGPKTPPGIGKKSHSPTGPAEAAESEVPEDKPGHPAFARDSQAPIFPGRPQLTIADVVRWEVESHPGFLPSFISSIKYAPITFQADRWGLIGSRCAARRASADPEKAALPRLQGDKVLVLLGKQDPVILADETEEDATAALGRENVKIVKLEGAHDVPIVNSKGCADVVAEFWGL